VAERSTRELIATLLVSFLGAGSGAVAWLKYFQTEPVSTSAPIAQDDFDSPVVVPFTLSRKATLTLYASATALAHNPDFGKDGWQASGLKIEAFVDNSPCSEPKILRIERPILDGRMPLRVDIDCGPKVLSRGQHVIRLSADFLGSCKLLETVPGTCNTNRIRGSYALIE